MGRREDGRYEQFAVLLLSQQWHYAMDFAGSLVTSCRFPCTKLTCMDVESGYTGAMFHQPHYVGDSRTNGDRAVDSRASLACWRTPGGSGGSRQLPSPLLGEGQGVRVVGTFPAVVGPHPNAVSQRDEGSFHSSWLGGRSTAAPRYGAAGRRSSVPHPDFP